MIRHTPWDSLPHDFAIGLKPIDEVYWLEGGEADAARKTALLAEGAEVWGEQAGSRPGQAEVLSLVQKATGRTADPALPPLWAAGLLCADDLCLMERRDGAWRLTAVSLCSGTFFTAVDALGKSLAELHGPVPGFADRFLSVVERMFSAVRPGVIMERRNWTLLNSGDLHLPRSAPMRALIPGIAPADAASSLFLRVERQTVRKLPDTGAVLFTIRVWRHPLAALSDDPQKLAAFAEAWRGVSEDFRAYKGLAHYNRLVEAFLASN
jgi:dimethylamine monooxygenase subunit A